MFRNHGRASLSLCYDCGTTRGRSLPIVNDGATVGSIEIMEVKKMNGNEIEKDFMKRWVDLSRDGKSKKECLEMAGKFDEMARLYDGIRDSCQKLANHYRDLNEMACKAAEANRRLAAEQD